MRDLTKGNPAQVMLLFAVPIALGNLFQLFYSLADTRVVGSTLGLGALAAVGATTSISTLFIGFLSGMSNGFGILVARAYGAGNEEEIKAYSAGSLTLGVLTALVLTLLCVGGLPMILRFLNVSAELVPLASGYIRVILLGLVMTFFYNGCASVLRAVGDTVAALAFLVCASFLNIALDLFFIVVMHTGVAGAAFATVLSQSLAAIGSYLYMQVRYPVFRFCLRDFLVSRSRAKELYASGFSMAAMMSLVYFGTLSLQCAINTFGNDIIVAHTAARKISEFFMLPFSVLSVTMATYCGQNMGAGCLPRIRLGIRQALFLACGWSVGMMILSYTVSPWLVHLVTGTWEPEILRTAGTYLKFDSLFYFAPAAICVLRNALQGMGEHRVPVFSSMIELIGKVLVAVFLAPVIQYWGIIVAEPVVWILMVIPLIVRTRTMLA